MCDAFGVVSGVTDADNKDMKSTTHTQENHMLVSDLLKHAVQHNDNTHRPLSQAAMKRLRNGDTIGYHFCGPNFQSYWVKAKVIGNDTRDMILFLQTGHEPMESYWYGEGDQVIAWPQA